MASQLSNLFDCPSVASGSGNWRSRAHPQGQSLSVLRRLHPLPLFRKLDWEMNGELVFWAKIVKVVGGRNLGGHGSGIAELGEGFSRKWDYRTQALCPVQWYPGHIAKTEKELKEQLKLMDVVIEVRDARIPLSTSHPQKMLWFHLLICKEGRDGNIAEWHIACNTTHTVCGANGNMDSWLGTRKKILVLNREDMISTADPNAWANYFSRHGFKVVFSNGQLGMRTMKLGRLAKTLAAGVNIKRRAKGLLPRPVRAGVVGYPNVGESSLINRLLKRRMCPAAPRPGVTRELKWVRFGKDLELLDSHGVLPMRISDQSAAIKLAICDEIGERSYDVADVSKALRSRFVQKVALHLFNGDVHQAAFRILTDFRRGKFGWIALDRPPQ